MEGELTRAEVEGLEGDVERAFAGEALVADRGTSGRKLELHPDPDDLAWTLRPGSTVDAHLSSDVGII